jgi:hypothetical protein
VWNRSIRGELNMRAYEAPACGALLMMESENLEVREVFADGESCALYGADDLERIIDAWLGSPARLAAAADAGWRRVQGETYAHHLSDLVDRARGLRRTPRAFRRLPGWRRRFWLALHALASADSARITAALTHLARAAECGGDPVALAATSGAATAMGATLAAPEAQQAWLDAARGLLATAVQADPDDLVSAMNLAWVERASRRGAEAAARWEQAHQRLDAAAPFPLDRIPVPFGFDRLRVAWERGSIAADLASRAEAFRPLLRARAAAELAGLSTGEAATRWWQASVDAAPHVSDNVRGLARALEAAGPACIAGAAAAWSDVVAADPLDWEAREGAVRTAVAAGQQARAAALVDDARCLARAIGEAPGAVGSPAAGRSPDPALPVGVTS